VPVSEPAASPPPPSPPEPARRSPLELGGLLTLAALALAGVLGVIAVFDSDSSAAGFGVGFGIALLIFVAGATIACALACLARGRVQYPALGALAAACLALDLVVLAIAVDIDSEWYGKLAGVLGVWSFFALVVLGLTLAVRKPERLARALYGGALAAAVLGGLISTWLVVTADDESGTSETAFENGTVVTTTTTGFGFVPEWDDELLQVLGAMLVLLAVFWFGALAASRLPDQTLKRTLTTSPSSTT
jgi:hypothetical protein